MLSASSNESRLMNELWNSSHVIVFFVFWLFIINIISWFRPLDNKRILMILIVTLVVSTCIEWVQSKVGRQTSWIDIKLSMVGSLLVIGIYAADLSKMKFKTYANITLIFALSIILGWPTVRSFIDEVIILKQAPVLSDFSSPFEKTRWKGNSSTIFLKENKLGLLSEFKPGYQYSSIELRHFYKKWTDYNKLNIDVENLESKKMTLSIRIHDKLHRLYMNAFNDRYTQSFTLKPGKNILRIEIETIKNSPKTRIMDMDNIEAIMLVMSKLEKSKKILINKVYLQ